MTTATKKPTAARKPAASRKPDPLPDPVLPTHAPAQPRARRRFREPTAKPSWPVLAIIGPDKVGKSYACAQASASDLIDRTFWVGFGEKNPDEYGAIAGTRFEIVEHDGTTADARAAIADAALEHRGDKPHLLVIDSGSRYYDAARASAEADAVAEGKDRLGNELWARVNTEWFLLLAAARRWDGPVLITARSVTANATEQGRVTAQTVEKVQGHQAFLFDVDGTVELIEPGRPYLAGIRSALMSQTRGEVPDLTIDGLWRLMGLDTFPIGSPTYAGAP